MDMRTRLISGVLEMAGELEYEVRQRVENALIICLNQYEVQERCTELVETEERKNYLRMYLATLRVEGRSEGTLRQYRLRIGQMLEFLGKSVEDITVYDLRYFLACYRRARKVSNSTLDNIRRCIKAFFAWLAAEEHIGRNPAAAIKPIQKQKVIRRAYSQKEMEKIRNACGTKRDIALVEFLYSSGCRVSEVSMLNVEDIDFLKMEAKVIGKGNKERIVYMTEKCAMYLQEYLECRKDKKEALFVHDRAPYKRLGKNGIEKMLKRLGVRAKVNNVHPHRYRRTMATDLINRGCNIQDVQKLLGHASISTTQIYYVSNQNYVKMAYQKFAV